jgi:DeoR/GlpR family transcriptional regulator of sugar metabolism
MKAYPIERHRRILELLQREGQLRTRELCKLFQITAMTAWRDLHQLEDQGLLRRVRGGAVRSDGPPEPAYDKRQVSAYAAKQVIAARAARLLRAGEVVILDGGSTVTALADQNLPANLTFLTNSLPVAERMRHHPARPTVHLSGGLLRAESGTLVGREAISFFTRRHARTFLMSASGLDAAAGITDPNPQEIEVKRAMATRSERIFLLIDSTKFGTVSLMETLSLRRIEKIISDKPWANAKRK